MNGNREYVYQCLSVRLRHPGSDFQLHPFQQHRISIRRVFICSGSCEFSNNLIIVCSILFGCERLQNFFCFIEYSLATIFLYSCHFSGHICPPNNVQLANILPKHCHRKTKVTFMSYMHIMCAMSSLAILVQCSSVFYFHHLYRKIESVIDLNVYCE